MRSSFSSFNYVVCSNTLFSNTSALTNSLFFRANSTCRVLEHLIWSNTSGFQFLGPLARTNFLLALCGLSTQGDTKHFCMFAHPPSPLLTWLRLPNPCITTTKSTIIVTSAKLGVVRILYLFSGESNRPLTPILLKSLAIHLPFLSRYFCKSMPCSWQKVVCTLPMCITMRLPFVSRYFCRSIRVRGRWDTPNFS